jgi:hypothetical protein
MPHQKFCSGFLSCYWLIFASVYPFLDAEEIRANVHFIAGFRNDFQNHWRLAEQLFRASGGYQKVGTSSLKSVSVRIFRLSLVSVLIEASKNFKFNFLPKNFKTIGAYSESSGLVLKSFKKIFISGHNHFNYC